MTDPTRDPNPDSPPRDDERGSIESLDDPRANPRDDDPNTSGLADETPDARNGAVGGTDGVVKNQDDTAQ